MGGVWWPKHECVVSCRQLSFSTIDFPQERLLSTLGRPLLLCSKAGHGRKHTNSYLVVMHFFPVCANLFVC